MNLAEFAACSAAAISALAFIRSIRDNRIDDLRCEMRRGIDDLRCEMRRENDSLKCEMRTGFIKIDEQFRRVDERFMETSEKFDTHFRELKEDFKKEIHEAKAELGGEILFVQDDSKSTKSDIREICDRIAFMEAFMFFSEFSDVNPRSEGAKKMWERRKAKQVEKK